MIKHFPEFDTNEVIWVVLGFGIAAYAVMLVAQVLQNYSLI
ncbi:MAG: hypothetical protein Q7N95_11755 [Alphaproteobacteria bacterium]|nr:hypothetical protein [Alphaproteobacteria bacterium]